MAAITDLATLATVDGGEWLAVNDGGTDKKLDVLNVAAAGVEIKTISVAALGGTENLSSWTPITLGIVMIVDTTGGNSAIFMAQGGANATVEMVDTNNQFSATIGAGSSVNFAYNSGYKIRNNQSVSRSIAVFAVGI